MVRMKSTPINHPPTGPPEKHCRERTGRFVAQAPLPVQRTVVLTVYLEMVAAVYQDHALA